MEFVAHASVATDPTGSFVPFTIVAGCSMDKAMEENSAHAPDRPAVEASEKTAVWRQFLTIERIKAAFTEVALGVTMFAALVVFCCFF